MPATQTFLDKWGPPPSSGPSFRTSLRDGALAEVTDLPMGQSAGLPGWRTFSLESTFVQGPRQHQAPCTPRSALQAPDYALYGPHLLPEQKIFEELARLYKVYQHDDIFARSNLAGGVHFNRDAGWFAKQMALPGARLLTQISPEGSVVSFSLFFTDPEHFPAFASDCLKFLRIPGAEKTAYLYLILTAPENRSRGVGTETYHRTLEICKDLGCPGIFHEYYVAPVPNTASMRLLDALERKYGYSFTYFGTTADHTRKGIDGNPETIVYQQVFVPTDRETFLCTNAGYFQLAIGAHRFDPIARAAL